jgi:IS5 family transposase
LDEIDRLIDWKPLEKVLRQKLKRVANAVGNPAYPPLLMFKILLLQR